jgi:hypothetical protein
LKPRGEKRLPRDNGSHPSASRRELEVKIYRAMTPDADGLPQVGRSARQLGVRPLDWALHNDVSAAAPDDTVNPGEGMSAAPDDPAKLPKNRRPPQVNAGTGKDPVWEIDTDDLGPSLQYVQDKAAHGVVGPKQPLTLAEFEEAWLRPGRGGSG